MPVSWNLYNYTYRGYRGKDPRWIINQTLRRPQLMSRLRSRWDFLWGNKYKHIRCFRKSDNRTDDETKQKKILLNINKRTLLYYLWRTLYLIFNTTLIQKRRVELSMVLITLHSYQGAPSVSGHHARGKWKPEGWRWSHARISWQHNSLLRSMFKV